MDKIKSGIKGQIDWPNVQGDGWSCRFRVARNGAYPANWTGYTFAGQVRQFASTTAALIATIAFDLDEGDGWVTMTATPVGSLAEGDYYYDVRWTPPGGVPKTLFGGKFPISSTVNP